jgi:hypothetical protein
MKGKRKASSDLFVHPAEFEGRVVGDGGEAIDMGRSGRGGAGGEADEGRRRP